MPAFDYDELVDRVTARTAGTASDPLTRDDVEQVVAATIAVLADVPELRGVVNGGEQSEPKPAHPEADPTATDPPAGA